MSCHRIVSLVVRRLRGDKLIYLSFYTTKYIYSYHSAVKLVLANYNRNVSGRHLTSLFEGRKQEGNEDEKALSYLHLDEFIQIKEIEIRNVEKYI